MEACLDRGHSEQLGQLSGSAAGRLISPAQFFTPYFINKKAVKKPTVDAALRSPPSGAAFHSLILPSLKRFLAVCGSFPVCRCGANLQTLSWSKSSRVYARQRKLTAFWLLQAKLELPRTLFIYLHSYLFIPALPHEHRSVQNGGLLISASVGHNCVLSLRVLWFSHTVLDPHLAELHSFICHPLTVRPQTAVTQYRISTRNTDRKMTKIHTKNQFYTIPAIQSTHLCILLFFKSI